MNRDDTYYEALRARDPRFDGKFFAGVKTTGIYCRPICPAKPKRENVEFFASALEAEKAGYRPCLRCRPESAPRSPAWVGKSAVVQRAMKLLHQHQALTLNEDIFAAKFGVTARHLRRLFVDEVGKTPKQIAFENRLALARQLIVETDLPLAEVALAAGFRSVRRFNGAFKIKFKKSPSEIRRRPMARDGGLQLALAYRPPLNFAALLVHYSYHQVGDLEWFEPGKMGRIFDIDGVIGRVVISQDTSRAQLILEIDVADRTKIHAIVARVRALFDVDSDPILVANKIETDRKLKALVKKHPGVRVPSGWDPFEVAISTILGQLVSLERGRALVADLVELLGRDSGLTKNGRSIKLFPTPASVARADLTRLKTTGIRKRTLKAFAQAVADGVISLEATQDVASFTKSLLSIYGIGPWTASYIALKALRDVDAFPETDLILARALEMHPKDVIERMSPWRGYVAMLLWREYAGTLSKTKGARN